MRIRRFVAKNSQEALRKVKKEMGPEAVILGSCNLPESVGPDNAPLLEVTAAVDLDSQKGARIDVRAETTTEERNPVRWQRIEQELQELKEILWSTEARSTLGVQILYLHRYAESYHPVGDVLHVDHFCGGGLGLQVANLRLYHSLLFTRRVVFGVLREVDVGTGLLDLEDDIGALDAL